MIFHFNKLNPNKISLSFTWDDNFKRHIDIIAPLFEQYGKRCTFYVNPGEFDFSNNLWSKYKTLSEKGHEIGSHGFTHHHYSKLSTNEFQFMLTESYETIQKRIGKSPVTFAFPHHDFNNDMLSKAHEIYFETRNTLSNTKRISLKSGTTSIDIKDSIEGAVHNGYSLVFSGHSISKISDTKIEGYEPISVKNLEKFLSIAMEFKDYSDICTFEQAALKEYIIQNCTYNRNKFGLFPEQVNMLEKFGLNYERIEDNI